MKRNRFTAPEGGREMLFEESARRAEAESRIRKLFESCGFCEVVTPALEYYDLFSEGAGALEQSDMYTLSDRLGRLLVLRPDSTKPIARLYASRLRSLELPVRLYYSQPVFRRNVALASKCDEVMQIGAELLGRGGRATDLELVSLAVESLARISEDFLFELSHVGVYKKLIESLGIPGELSEQIREAIASKNYSALDALLEENAVRDAEKLKLLPRLFGGREVLKEARALFAGGGAADAEALRTLDSLGELMENLERLGVKGKLSFDLALVNEYNYYTGIVFKGYLGGREVLSGGRYDTLYSDFGLKVDAVGFAVDLDALAPAVSLAPRAQVLVCSSDAVAGLRRQRELESEGRSSQLAVGMSREEARAYAERLGAAIEEVE